MDDSFNLDIGSLPIGTTSLLYQSVKRKPRSETTAGWREYRHAGYEQVTIAR
ncbi:hypothetical protein J2Y69_002869 [Microbacterium resistens]|uniref:Uncharacterized protein n=1 Tax=Microbacterium resistens TaxID=156977 RepID=A0ABU1SF84_9MICO|nr:hypothetical protein [Microbacterium resistens]